MLELRFDGRSAVVTGGGGACGGAIARGLADLGADVTVADLDGEAAEAVAAEIRSRGGRATAAQVDVSRRDSVRALFAGLDGKDGRPAVDILVTAAGAIRYASILDQSAQDVDLIVDVNVKGTYNCLQESARMMAGNGGAIVNIASTAAFSAPRLLAAAYSMSKGAIRQLTVAAAVELAPYGIRVNAVAPGTIPTQFTQDTLTTDAQLEQAARAVPMGRLGTVDDVVGPTLFLCSSLAAYVTGQVLAVDGGKLGRAG